MKVAFALMHPFSESMGSVVRVRELALSLGRAGVEVFIMTPYERSFDLSRNVHVISGLRSFSWSSHLTRKLYSFSKQLYYGRIFPNLYSNVQAKMSGILTGLVKGIAEFLVKEKINIVQVEQDAAGPIGVALKRATGLPLILDIHNISSEELVALGCLERGSEAFFKMQESLTRVFSQADRLVVVSEHMRRYVNTTYGLAQEDITIVPPGGTPIVDRTALKRRVLPFKVVYAGLVALREHVDLYVRSIARVKNRDSSIQFFITNKGEALDEIKKLARNLGVAPSFFWYNNFETVNDFLLSCHLGILCSSDDLARQMGTPAKLFTYMSAGLPVVANDIGGWSRIIEEEKVGVLTKDAPEDFALAIDELLRDEHLRNEYSSNALNSIAQKYNWDKSSETLMKVYESLL
jgi:glycosyltransferase involved in cell wall biosynthesis